MAEPRTLTRALALLAAIAGSAAVADEPTSTPASTPTSTPTNTIEEQRDELIALITQGKDVEANTKKLAALVKERDKTVATSHAAVEAQREAARSEREWLEQYKKSADYDLGWRCTLSVDPLHPVPSDEGRFRADWGRVVKKESLRLAPKNALDDGEPATLYEIAGQARHYFIRGEKFGPGFHRDFVADVGDWALVCDGDDGHHDNTERIGWRGSADDPSMRVPDYWRRLQRHGFAARIAAPPKIAHKARWNPIHITSTKYFWAIHDVRWKYPPDAFVLSNLQLKGQVDGRWEVEVEQRQSFLIEVPPSLPRRESLQPGRYAWLIMGQPRFDRALHKLVLVAADIEPTYVTEK